MLEKVEVVVVEVAAVDPEVSRAMEMGQAMEVEVEVAVAGMEVVEEVEAEVVEVTAVDPEVVREVEVAVAAMEEEEVVVVEVEVEEDLALALVVGQVMALGMEEGKAKACREHEGYLFFYITPFTVVFQNKIAGAHACMNIACWRVIATVHACIAINKVTFSNAINKRKHFNYPVYFIDDFSANPNQK